MGKRVWMADDGKIFDTKAELKAYEEVGPHGDLIQSYLDDMDVGDVSARAEKQKITHVKNILRDFLAWQDEQDAQAVGDEMREAA